MQDAVVPIMRPTTATATVERELDERLKRFLLDPAFKAGVEIRQLDGVWEAPHQPAIYETANEGAWLFADYKHDLAALELGGAIAVPREQLERLHALAKAEIRCDLVAIAHELPVGWSPGQRLVPNPPTPTQQEALQAFSKQIGAASRATAQAAGAAAQATAVAAGTIAVIGLGTAVGLAAAPLAGVAAAPAAAPSMLLSLDPIIYGGVEHNGQVRWAELARWYW